MPDLEPRPIPSSLAPRQRQSLASSDLMQRIGADLKRRLRRAVFGHCEFDLCMCGWIDRTTFELAGFDRDL
jgi:hypothetical protein